MFLSKLAHVRFKKRYLKNFKYHKMSLYLFFHVLLCLKDMCYLVKISQRLNSTCSQFDVMYLQNWENLHMFHPYILAFSKGNCYPPIKLPRSKVLKTHLVLLIKNGLSRCFFGMASFFPVWYCQCSYGMLLIGTLKPLFPLFCNTSSLLQFPYSYGSRVGSWFPSSAVQAWQHGTQCR